MLELLILAFLGNQSDEFLSQEISSTLPTIEIIEPSKIPSQNAGNIKPKLLDDEGLAIFALDLKSNKALFQKESNRSQNIASLTKLMTFLLIYENHDLNEVVTVSQAAARAPGAQIDLYAYEQLTVKTLLEAILIPSANDAAKALASFHAGTEDEFVIEMNQKAQKLGLKSAKFYNASGLDIIEPCDEPDCTPKFHGNKMSAQDLMTLTRILLKNEFFRKTIQKEVFEGYSIDREFFHTKPTTNKLFDSIVDTKGVKTGYTKLARQCFINLSENNEGDEIITILLGSSDRFGETVNLVSWILSHYDWR